MFNNQKKTFGFRKAKNVTTIGGTEVGNKVVKSAIVAGTLAVLPFMAGQNTAHADEVTATADTTTAVPVNPNPATNLEAPQPAQTGANVTANANAGTSVGDKTVTAPIVSADLNQAVSDAKTAGVNVATEANKDYTNIADANADLASQTKAVEDATAQKQANTDAIKKANAQNAQIDAQNAQITQANADAKAKYESDLAKYTAEKQAYDQAQANRTSNVSNDTVFSGRGVADTLNGYGTTTSDEVTIDKDGNWVLKEPIVDPQGIIGYITSTGKFNYTVNYDPAQKKSVTIVTGVTFNTWKLDQYTPSISGNTNAVAVYKDLSGNIIYSHNYTGLSSIGEIAVNKTYSLDKVISLADGETSPEFEFMKTAPKWEIEAPSALLVKLSYNGQDLPTVTTPPAPPKVTPLIPNVTTPKTLTVNVAVHPVTVSQTPTIVKDVINDDGVSVDGKLVPKNSTEFYTLSFSTIKAGHPVYKDGEVVVHDALPLNLGGGDLEAVKALNPNWVFFYDEATNSYSAKPTDAELAKLNQTGVDYTFKSIVLPANPLNDNGTYENTFSFQLGGYLVYSNKVVDYTPGTDDPNDNEHGNSTIQPTKQVLDLEGNDINNKTVQAGQKIVYVGKWDLDQYKGIVAGAIAISKGFGFIDNYDETKEVIDVKGTTIKSASGKDVTGLTPYIIKNLADAPQEIKDLVINSGVDIKDNDEFVIWVADDKKAFFDTYVVTGDSIFFTMPATIKDSVKTGDSIDNVVYQIDFGNGYAGNWVHNTVENPVPETPKETPAPKQEALPTTGDNSGNFLAGIGMGIVAMLSGLAFFKKEEN